jgi:hypothetical protein
VALQGAANRSIILNAIDTSNTVIAREASHSIIIRGPQDGPGIGHSG